MFAILMGSEQTCCLSVSSSSVVKGLFLGEVAGRVTSPSLAIPFVCFLAFLFGRFTISWPVPLSHLARTFCQSCLLHLLLKESQTSSMANETLTLRGEVWTKSPKVHQSSSASNSKGAYALRMLLLSLDVSSWLVSHETTSMIRCGAAVFSQYQLQRISTLKQTKNFKIGLSRALHASVCLQSL